MSKYTKTTINDKTYTLRPTKQNGTLEKIGNVPVADCTTLYELQKYYSDSYICARAIQGAAIELQAKARNIAKGDRKFTDADYDRIAPKLLAEDTEQYVGQFSVLRADSITVWENESDDDNEYNEFYVFTQLA